MQTHEARVFAISFACVCFLRRLNTQNFIPFVFALETHDAAIISSKISWHYVKVNVKNESSYPEAVLKVKF